MNRPRWARVWLSILLLVLAGCSESRPMPGASAEVDASVVTASLDARAQVRAAYVAARQAEGASDPAYAVRAAATGDGFVAMHEAMRLRAEVGANGATLRKAGEAWGATLAGARYGCAGSFLAAIERTAAPRVGATANRVEVAGRAAAAPVDEWYVHGPLGLEQGFTLGESACEGGGGDLAIELRLEGLEATTNRNGNGLDLRDAAGVVRMRYTDLWARDASGAALVATMDAVPGGIALRVDARGAKFPVTVDPLAWLQTAELTASDGAASDLLAYSVSISGTLAIVGAPDHAVGANSQQGAAYVFAQSGTTWTEQAELTASDGVAHDQFGYTVAISGTLAIVGPIDHTVGANADQGAAYVFAQSGTTWTEQAELTASDGAQGDYFGTSVSLSGTAAIVGALFHTVGANAHEGAAYMFARSGATWSQRAELTASDGAAGDAFGDSVSLSGTLAIVGASNHTVGASAAQGAAYVFAQSGTLWTQQAELTASDGATDDDFGVSVALSGTTAIVGAQDHTVGANAAQGAAYVLVQSGTTWTEQQELTASDGASGDEFGHAVALSGTTAIVGAQGHTVGANGAQGAAYVLVQSGTTWTEQQELTASDGAPGDDFGHSVSLSGTTAIVAGTQHMVGANAKQGAAYIEALLPADGSPCSSGADCGTGFCVSNVCCNTACGPCGDCSSGTCANFVEGSAGTPACALPFACNGSSATCPTSCAGDADCIATDYCSGSACVPAQASSASCTEDRQCTSGNCSIAGICAGSSANGTVCTAADQCETGYCASGVCCNSACTAGPCQACNVSGAVGTCETEPVTSPGSPSCAPYACNGSSTACPTTCAQDAQCSPADHCSAGSCVAKQAMGTTCTADDQCASASCVSGICVGLQLNGTTCTAADQCSLDYCVTGICCNTACPGACATCATGSCGAAPETSPGGPSCAPYVCDGADTTCPTVCSADANCIASDYCSDNACVPAQANGGACTEDRQCASGNCSQAGICSGGLARGAACTAGDQCVTGLCVDGFCCNTACTGQCQACDVAATPGLCSQVNGDPHGQRAACAGAGTTCGASCTASGGQQACQYAAGGTTCGSTSCSDQQVVTSACDGTGTCAPEAATPCPGNLACVDTACRTSCATTTDCASGFGCTDGACKPMGGSVCSNPHTSTNTTSAAGDAGSSTDCSPYVCVQSTGKCATTCSSVTDCVAPSVCNPSGQCVAPVASTGSSGGCTTAPGGASEGRAAIWLLGAAMIAIRRRRGEESRGRLRSRTGPRARARR